MKNIVAKFFMCTLLGMHEWTSKYQQGIKPTKEELDSGVEGFKQYSKMYCSRCGHESKLNL